MDTLESRLVPTPFDAAAWLPGTVPWDTSAVATEYVIGDFNGDGRWDEDAFVAGPGGSERVFIRDLSGNVIFDHVFDDPNFRGGGRMTSVHLPGGDALVVVPGPGGGPIVHAFTLNGSFDRTYTPYDLGFRGGLFVDGVSVEGVPSIVVWPGDGGGPELKVIEPLSGSVTHDLWIGPQTDRSGLYAPIPAGFDPLGVYVDSGPMTPTVLYPWDGGSGGSSGGPGSLNH